MPNTLYYGDNLGVLRDNVPDESVDLIYLARLSTPPATMISSASISRDRRSSISVPHSRELCFWFSNIIGAGIPRPVAESCPSYCRVAPKQSDSSACILRMPHMAVPEFYKFMRPVLEILSDRQTRHVRDIHAAVISILGLTQSEQDELIPSGVKTRVRDRTEWAVTYLRQAQLVERTKPALNRISERGLAYLKRAPAIIRPENLLEFPEFVDFKNRTNTDSSVPKASAVASALPNAEQRTPEESMNSAFAELNAALGQQLLEQVKSMSPAFFEQLIVHLMLKLGYGGPAGDAGTKLGKSGDEGVDGVIKQDKLGLDNIYLQAKRWTDGTIGRKEIQAFVGALTGQGASKGVFITTSSFSRDAIEFARHAHPFKLSLVDGSQLATLMIEHDLGVTEVAKYEVKRVDSDYFIE